MRLFYTILICLFSNQLLAQQETGSIENKIVDIIAALPGPGGMNFRQANASEWNTFRLAMEALLNNDSTSCRAGLQQVGYSLINFSDTASNGLRRYQLIQENEPRTRFWGTFVLKPDACRSNLVLQAPHPVHDFNTGKEAVFCFKRLDAFGLFVSGAHRCNHTAASPCDGTTTVCSGIDEAFRISDPAHNDSSLFQLMTSVLMAHRPDMQFIQLHGFSKLTDDPSVIMSNGTDQTPATDYALAIRDALLAEDPALTFKIPHIDLSWSRLNGFSNVQGRLINGSADPCYTSASNVSGQFLHIEQEKDALRADSTGWYKMYRALEQAFACNTSEVSTNAANQLRIYPNPVESAVLYVDGNKEGTKLCLFGRDGRLVFQTHLAENLDSQKINLTGISPGWYFIVIGDPEKSYRQSILIH